MNAAEVVHELNQRLPRSSERALARTRLIRLLGPLTSLAGVLWALVQPYRITLLHPHGQGFWWLFSEPPLYVILVGLLFALLIAPGLIEDLEVET
ncbi:MAG: hypothetical protein ABR569_02975 [Gaiellaceae bacterium]